MAVSTLEPRKNFVRLLEAYALLKERGRLPGRLGIAGKAGSAEPEVLRAIDRCGLSAEVKLLGYAPESDIAALYSGALGYVSLSLYEGFGLTALEAMSCGLSGVVSERSSLPEVVGETAILADPEDTEAIADALDRFATDPDRRQRLARAAAERAARFSAGESARRMVRILRESARSAA